jgi:hypothetical protein
MKEEKSEFNRISSLEAMPNVFSIAKIYFYDLDHGRVSIIFAPVAIMVSLDMSCSYSTKCIIGAGPGILFFTILR